MKSAIDQARYLMKCRKFSDAISILNEKREIYEESFDYFYTLGLAFLYVGDTGSASVNFGKAREIKINDVNLLLAQAAIFLRRGDTERAVQYYLDMLDLDPLNNDAKHALEFVRVHGDYEEICRCVDDGRIESCYPKLGANPLHIRNMVLCLCCGALFGFLLVRFWPHNNFASAKRADLSSLMLTATDNSDLIDTDAGGNYKYILSAREIKSSYNKAAKYFQEYRDNAAQKELNRILSSNAALGIKHKCRSLMGYFTAPTFDTLTDNYSYKEVAAEPELYLDCYVDWSGRVSNAVQDENAYSCDLLVGYEDMKNVEGIVRVYFDFLPVPEIDGSNPVRILGRISNDMGKVILEGRSVFQSVKGVYGD